MKRSKKNIEDKDSAFSKMAGISCKIIFFAVFLFLDMNIVVAQTFAKWDKQSLTLDNGVIRRVIQLGDYHKGIVSGSLKLAGDEQEFLMPDSEEFYFNLDGKAFTGLADWNVVSITNTNDENKGDGAVVILELPSLKLKIGVTYLLYPKLPIIRKKISFTNLGLSEYKLESLDIENLLFKDSGTGTSCWVLNDYARQKSLGSFVGNWYDPLVVVHDETRSLGFVLGNEAPGVMKRTTAFLKPNKLTIGLTHSDQSFGFRKWIKPGETWESPLVFSGVYSKTNDPYTVINGSVNDFVRKYMGIRLNNISEKPTFVYNTWYPFRTMLNDTLIRDVAKAASECGVQEFVLDDGWQVNIGSSSSKESWGNNYGDWKVDEAKFPGGLKPTFDYIRSLGMKPGLWISIGSATNNAKVFKDHPEWFIKDYAQRLGNLHNETNSSTFYTSCFGTDWFDYIKEVIVNLVNENGLAYAKLDLSVVTSAYINNDSISGCYATDHPFHKDREESLLVIYNRVLELFDDLHREAPSLFIDCTFETAGKLQLMDYAIAKHAEGNWLSNFEEAAPIGSLRVRQMAWWRSPILPATSLVIGNQALDDPGFELSMKSLAGTLPIVLGDPRKLSAQKRASIKSYADWLKTMQKKYDFMTFRQDLPGFGEPQEGMWDGFQRINSDSHSGGIVGVFRQGAAENNRTITVNHLDLTALYQLKSFPEGNIVIEMTGKDLAEKGFHVKLNKKYDGALFEIERIK